MVLLMNQSEQHSRSTGAFTTLTSSGATSLATVPTTTAGGTLDVTGDTSVSTFDSSGATISNWWRCC